MHKTRSVPLRGVFSVEPGLAWASLTRRARSYWRFGRPRPLNERGGFRDIRSGEVQLEDERI